MQKHLLLHARQVSLVCTHTHAHPRREFDFLLSHKLSLYPRHDTIFLKGAHEWGRTPDGKIYELIHALLQSSPAVSHLIRGPEDITVYLPVLPCTRVSTCLPAGLPLTLCVYFGYFQGGVVRSWKCETVSWQADQNCWRAWQEKGSIVWPGVHRGVRGEGEEPKTGIERKEDSEKKRKCGWQISVWGTRLFRRQDGGWSSMMMNHDGSTQHSAQYLLGAALTRAEWRGGGEQPPAASRHRAKMERGHLGHLFIYFLPYAVSSAMLQWVSSMRHKVNAPSTLWGWAGISATRAAYSNSQHRKWPSGRFWMGTKLFWHFTPG